MRLLSFLMMLGLAPAAQAGWVSGGGELVKDAANPWFIQNTEVVTACIDVDAEHFHLPAGRADLQRDYVEPVLAYWRQELAASKEPIPNAEPLPWVGTQRFVFGPCSDETELRFQFGTLLPAQVEHFKELGQNPQSFTSIAVRTAYDQVNLRGRGFIYIAADSGALQPKTPDLLNQPWARGQGGLLLKVLAHEVGHVFGVPHTSGSSETTRALEDLMNGTYPEALVTTTEARNIDVQARATIPHFFTAAPGSDHLGCILQPNAATRRFLGIDAANCLAQVRNGDKIEFVDVSHHGAKKVIGTATFMPSRYRTNIEWSIRLWLPPQQQVVKRWADNPWGDQPLPRTLPIAPWRSTLQQLGTYRNADGTVTRSMILTQGPGVPRFSVGGALDSGVVVQIPFFGNEQ